MATSVEDEVMSYAEGKARETLFPGNLWWNISSYSYLSKRTDECIESPHFHTGLKKEASWCVKFFPGGTTANPACYASLSLVLCSYPEHNVIAKFRLRVCDVAGYDLVFPIESEYRMFSTRHDELMFLETKGISFDEGLQRRSVPLQRDQIDILCDIVMMKPDIVSRIMKILSPREYLSEDMRRLLLSGNHADAQLSTSGSTILAHSAVLAARSTKFPDFFEDVNRAQFRIEMDGSLDYRVMSDFVKFLYAGKTTGIQNKPIELLIAASKYRVKDLKNACEEFLIINNHFFTVSRATELLAITFEYEVGQKLKDRIFKFVRDHIHEIQGTAQWAQMLQKFPDQASQLITFTINV